MSELNSDDLQQLVIDAMDDLKARDIRHINVEGVAGFFIVRGIVADQFGRIEFEPGINVLLLDAICDLFDQGH